MHQTTGTNTSPRWELGARVASGVLFAVAVVGLFLPSIGRFGRSETQTGLEFLFSQNLRSGESKLLILATVVALTLGVRRTRGAAFRAIVAAVAMAPFAWQIWFPLGGPPILMGAWVTFWALVCAFATNVIAALAGRRSRTDRGGTERPVLPRGPWS